MSRSDVVSVTIVTYNSGRFIKRCLESVLDQQYPFKEIIVIDNNSSDGTIDILEPFEDRCRIVYNEENIGFAAAQNQAISLSTAEWVLTLNPDVLLLQGFIEALVAAGSLDGRVGTVCGKLLTMTAGFEFPSEPLVDSTGIYFTPNLRHLDRGSLEVDNGHFRSYEYVFGATAAAALYRREMIDDISINDEFFDNDFFVYREDADVAWRAQLMGWKCLYAPYAKGYHVRKVLPGNRRALPPEINMHSVKNRFLMRMKKSAAIFTGVISSPSRRAIWWWLHAACCGSTLRSGHSCSCSGTGRASWRNAARSCSAGKSATSTSQAGSRSNRSASPRRRSLPHRELAPKQPAVNLLRIAILGTRGIPANYGGFETFAEELSIRLSRRGYEVTVYCRERRDPPEYRGVRAGLAAHHPPQILRHSGAHLRFDSASAGAPRGCRRSIAMRETRCSPFCRAWRGSPSH